MCAHRSFRSACASTQFDQSSMGALWVAKGLMFLHAEKLRLLSDCAWQTDFESSLYVHANLYIMLDTGPSFR